MSRRKLLICVGLTMVLITTMIPFGWSQQKAPANVKTLKGMHAWPATMTTTQPYFNFRDVFNEAFKNQFTLQDSGGPEVMAAVDQPRALKLGSVDILQTATAYYRGDSPAGMAIQYQKYGPADFRKSGFYDLFNRISEQEMNARFLAFEAPGTYAAIWTKKKVAQLSDLKGLNLRTTPGYLSIIKALGAIPISIPSGEIYSAVQKGTIDGFVLSSIGLTSNSLQEVVKYMIDIPFWASADAIIMNVDSWKSLTKAQQDRLTKLSMEHENWCLEFNKKAIAAERDIMTKAGMVFVTFSPQDTKTFLDIAYNVGFESLRNEMKDKAAADKLIQLCRDSLPK